MSFNPFLQLTGLNGKIPECQECENTDNKFTVIYKP